jgi:hypothetical protein
MEDWTEIGTKKLADAPISSLAVSRDGKSLALYVELNSVFLVRCFLV